MTTTSNLETRTIVLTSIALETGKFKIVQFMQECICRIIRTYYLNKDRVYNMSLVSKQCINCTRSRTIYEFITTQHSKYGPY